MTRVCEHCGYVSDMNGCPPPHAACAPSQTPACVHCGDTGSVRVHSHEDYGVSFECEYCDRCDLGRGLIAADLAAWESGS